MRKYRNAASDYEYGAMLGENLNFAASEAYKLLRTNLDFALSDEQKCRIIGMTSSVRGEGKSTTTLNLAYSIAEAGKLVLVIEADMRMSLLAICEQMATTPSWAEGLLLHAEGYECSFYKKD